MSTLVDNHHASKEEWTELVDHAARFHLGIAGDEFVRRVREDGLDDLDEVRLMRVLVLLPDELAR